MNNKFAVNIESIELVSFTSLISGRYNGKWVGSIDIKPQVLSASIYESIGSPIIKVELAVQDFIGLFVNFPLAGEEAIFLTYTNADESIRTTLSLLINRISHINTADNARSQQYLIHCHAIESFGNNRNTVQQAYENMYIPQIVHRIYDEHIVDRVRKIFPSYRPQLLQVSDNTTDSRTVIIPNLYPFSAFVMLGEMLVSENSNNHTYKFFQTTQGFKFMSVQEMVSESRLGQRRKALNNKYIYAAGESENPESVLKNEGRVITNLTINNRIGSFDKVSQGYYHNALFEINMMQKYHNITSGYLDAHKETLYPNPLNTLAFQQTMLVNNMPEEHSKRTRYVINNQPQHDQNYPPSNLKEKWSTDIHTHIAMGQIDLTVTIPGNVDLVAGDLFYADIPEFHGFNNVELDDLITGYFLITDVKHILQIGGLHATVLRINKVSYKTPLERPNRYLVDK